MTNYTDIWHQLLPLYDACEAQAIVRCVLEMRFGLSATDIYCGKVTQLSAEENTVLDKIMHRLVQAEPMQYVLEKAVFCGRSFKVAHGVLIPRPETEELCQWVKASVPTCPAILDIGTGSGCIAVTLAKDIEKANVTAWDISKDAIRIARYNAEYLEASVHFVEQDALNAHDDVELWDVVVSNPPYVCEREKAQMERNVLEYEPSIALFVPNEDPLLFYRTIVRYATKALKHGGLLFFEINPIYVADITARLRTDGFIDIETKDDFCGKQRFTKARRP